MDGAPLPPRPDLLGDERQEGSEQALEDRKRATQRAADRRLAFAIVGRAVAVAVARVVAAALDQLQVVVAEPPEEALDAQQRAGVVVLLEALGRVGDDGFQARDHRAIDGVGQRLALDGQIGEREL